RPARPGGRTTPRPGRGAGHVASPPGAAPGPGPGRRRAGGMGAAAIVVAAVGPDLEAAGRPLGADPRPGAAVPGPDRDAGSGRHPPGAPALVAAAERTVRARGVDPARSRPRAPSRPSPPPPDPRPTPPPPSGPAPIGALPPLPPG